MRRWSRRLHILGSPGKFAPDRAARRRCCSACWQVMGCLAGRIFDPKRPESYADSAVSSRDPRRKINMRYRSDLPPSRCARAQGRSCSAWKTSRRWSQRFVGALANEDVAELLSRSAFTASLPSVASIDGGAGCLPQFVSLRRLPQLVADHQGSGSPRPGLPADGDEPPCHPAASIKCRSAALDPAEALIPEDTAPQLAGR